MFNCEFRFTFCTDELTHVVIHIRSLRSVIVNKINLS